VNVKKRKQALLATLAVVMAIAAYVAWPRATGSPSGQGSRRGGVRTPAGAATDSTEAPDVHLEALAGERPMPGDNERNLFKFKPKYVPPPADHVPPPAIVVGPPPVPPMPPIPLKFIGVLEGVGSRIAILSDGRGAPMYGKEGEAVLGQYKILRIGAESIEMEYLDGHGRQTIRLSGS
jgi:hypothetical protein